MQLQAVAALSHHHWSRPNRAPVPLPLLSNAAPGLFQTSGPGWYFVSMALGVGGKVEGDTLWGKAPGGGMDLQLPRKSRNFRKGLQG